MRSRWLDTTVDNAFEDARGTQAILTKTAADQLVWAPIMTVVFFVVLKALEGHAEAIIPTIEQRVLPTLLVNYAVWPLAHIISFKYVPSEQRVLYNNVIAIAWNCYLSMTVGADVGNVVPQEMVLPTLSELSHRLSESVPHHHWLMDYLQKVGLDTPHVQTVVETVVRTEMPLLRQLIIDAIAQQHSSAAYIQFHVDYTAQFILELQTEMMMLR